MNTYTSKIYIYNLVIKLSSSQLSIDMWRELVSHSMSQIQLITCLNSSLFWIFTTLAHWMEMKKGYNVPFQLFGSSIGDGLRTPRLVAGLRSLVKAGDDGSRERVSIQEREEEQQRKERKHPPPSREFFLFPFGSVPRLSRTSSFYFNHLEL